MSRKARSVFAMNGYKLLLALLGATSAGMVQAGDCDTCQVPNRPASTCACCDDSGLLDVIDQVAGRVHSELRVLSGSRSFGKSHLLCDHGCDILVGHEAVHAHDTFDCPNCHDGGGADAVETTVIDDGTGQSTAPSSSTPVRPPSRLRSVPAPGAVPDEQADPFVDEPRTSGRTIPGRTIEYQRKSPVRTQYGQRYNTQAQNTSTADYWAGSEQEKVTKAKSVKTVAAEPATVEDDFQNAYRRRVVDQGSASETDVVTSESDSPEHSILEPLPTKNAAVQPLNRASKETLSASSQFHNPLRP
jgi:hypothetical protein